MHLNDHTLGSTAFHVRTSIAQIVARPALPSRRGFISRARLFHDRTRIATHFRLHRSVSGFLPAAVSFIVVLPSQAFQVPPAMLVQRRREATHLIPTDVAHL
jgi:hypothetical protein